MRNRENLMRAFLNPLMAFGDEVRTNHPATIKDNIFGMMGANFMPLELVESDTSYQVKVEIPGVEKDKINVYVDDDRHLNIEAEKVVDYEEKTDKEYYSERSYGGFKRKIYLENNIDTESIDAKYNNGVLTVNLSKKAPSKKLVSVN